MVIHSSRGATEFRFHLPEAHQVFLVGELGEPQECRVPMNRDDDGEWVCHLDLPQGVFRYRFLADGEWHVDRESAGVGWAPFDCNSLTILSEDSQMAGAFAG